MAFPRNSIFTILVILLCATVFLGGAVVIINWILGAPGQAMTFGTKIGVVPITGVIDDSRQVVSQIVKFRKDKAVKAIILRINSPGGRVAPAQEIYREVRKTLSSKNVLVSMGDVAASGGYYIAAAADKIVANPGTMVGSIGVIMEFLQVQDLLQKAGVGFEVLKSGEFKDIGSPHREMTPRERLLLQDLIQDILNQFVNAVAEGRALPVDKVKEIADGRIFTGAKGKELGLVDELGNFEDTVDLAKDSLGITGEVTLVYPEKEKPGLLDLLVEGAARGLVEVFREAAGTHLEYRWGGLSPESPKPFQR